MNKQPHITTINNSALYTVHAAPLPVYGTDQSLERYEYQRKTPVLGIDTVTTKLEKKYYGNSTNRSASHIAERKRVNQIGIYSNTTPISFVNDTNSVKVASSALQRVRNRGCVLPKKCGTNPSITVTPSFNGRSIATNPGNVGGHRWFNLSHNRWNKFCASTIKNVVSKYYPDYVRGSLGSSAQTNLINMGYSAPGGVLQSSGSAKTYTDINKRLVYQPYNPTGF